MRQGEQAWSSHRLPSSMGALDLVVMRSGSDCQPTPFTHFEESSSTNTSCVTLGQSPTLSVPPFPLLCDGKHYTTFLREPL